MSSKQTYSTIEASVVQAENVTDEVIMVEVEAPATLQAGYVFNATYEGHVFPVVVPEGGSVQGQKFAVPYKPGVVHATSVQANITGAWKDDIFDCSTFGVCHPSLVNACCCPLILLGQVMTRLKLDWLAKPASDADFKQTFSTMACIFAVYAVVSLLFSPVDPDEPSPIYNLVNFIYGIFLLVIMTQVRKIVRAKYEIPEERCIGCEDLCCAFWCSCCTVAQLARQTADYDSEEAAFFTNDGLAKSSMTPVLTV